jgi:T5orf172 domain
MSTSEPACVARAYFIAAKPVFTPFISTTQALPSPIWLRRGVDFNFTAARVHAAIEHPPQRRRRVDSAFGSDSEEASGQNAHVQDENDPGQSASPSNSSINSTASTHVPPCWANLRDRLEKILPMDTRNQLREDPKRCVARTRNPGNPRCKRNLKDNVPSTLTELITESTDKISLARVRRLIESARCGSSHRRPALFDFDKICKGLDEMSEDARSEFNEWIKGLASEPQSTPHDRLISSPEIGTVTEGVLPAAPRPEAIAEPSTSSRRQTRSMTARSRLNHATAVASIPITTRNPSLPYFQNFEPYQPKSIANHSVREVLRSLLLKPLSDRETSPGSIYMYWYPGNFGYVKIGTTCGDPEKRLGAWERKCKHPIERLNGDLGTVAHVFRVEALIHAELKGLRFREVKCRGCKKSHIEWFRVTPELARCVYMKWADLMAIEPYVYVAGGWRLRPDIGEEEIERLCRPVDTAVTPPINRPQTSSNSRRRSSRLHNGLRRSQG